MMHTALHMSRNTRWEPLLHEKGHVAAAYEPLGRQRLPSDSCLSRAHVLRCCPPELLRRLKERSRGMGGAARSPESDAIRCPESAHGNGWR